MSEFKTEITIGDASIPVLIEYSLDGDALDYTKVYYKGRELNYKSLSKYREKRIEDACYADAASYAGRCDD